MKTECMEKLLHPGQRAGWQLLLQGWAQGGPQGGRACPPDRDNSWVRLTGPGPWSWARAGQKANPQGWAQLHHGLGDRPCQGISPNMGTGPGPRCSTGTAELQASTCQGRQRLRAPGWVYSEPLGLWLWRCSGWDRSGPGDTPRAGSAGLGVPKGDVGAYRELWPWAPWQPYKIPVLKFF